MSGAIAVDPDIYKILMKELRYLKFFFREADFGPAHEDVIGIINDRYDEGVPDGYRLNEEDEES